MSPEAERMEKLYLVLARYWLVLYLVLADTG